MSLTVLYTITRASNFKSITVQDNGTAFGSGGNMSTGDVASITLDIFGVDKEAAAKSVAFTGGEMASFLAGDPVTFYFTDSRLWQTQYSPDNYYTCELILTGGTSTTQLVPFDSYFFMDQVVMNWIANVNVPINTYYEANAKITGILANLLQLNRLSAGLTIPRETAWRKVYNNLAYNFNTTV